MNGLSFPGRIIYIPIVLLSAALTLSSTDNAVDAGVARIHGSAPATTIALPSDAVVLRTKEAAPAADDTGRNARDRDGMTMTPLDQSNDPDDVKITRKIRKARRQKLIPYCPAAANIFINNLPRVAMNYPMTACTAPFMNRTFP